MWSRAVAMSRGTGLDRRDWQLFLLSCLGGIGLGLLVLQLLLTTVFEPALLEESALRVTRSVRLVEQVLQTIPPEHLPPGVVVDQTPGGPEPDQFPLNRFDRQLIERLGTVHHLKRELRRDLPPLRDPWGGYWIQLQSRSQTRPIWLYQPERLSTNVWFLPVLRVLTLLLGSLLGIVVFLNQRVENPFRTVLRQLPDTFLPPLALLPEQGIAPLRQLTRRINRLLERINSADRSRRQLLRGLAHDLTSPQARLMLKLEWFRDTLSGEAGRQLDGVENDLQQLARITEELMLLAELDAPRRRRTLVLLDDLCARVATSYAAGSVELQVPQLLVSLDPVALERVLSNLIDNGMEHGRAPVRIRAARSGGRLQLQIDDHGAGLSSPTRLTMPAPPLARDRQRTRHRGLGLAMVEAFCHDHGGRLELGTSELGGLRVRLDLAGSVSQPIFPATAAREARAGARPGPRLQP